METASLVVFADRLFRFSAGARHFRTHKISTPKALAKFTQGCFNPGKTDHRSGSNSEGVHATPGERLQRFLDSLRPYPRVESTLG